MTRLLNWLEKLGHKALFVDFYGEVLMHRWFLFYYEEEKAQGWWYWLPNVWIHLFPLEETPDGDDPHRHPWSTLTFIISGWYKELINNVKERINKRLRFGYLDYKDNHRILEVSAGTYSVFMHGWRKQDWTFDVDKCTTVCQACVDLRGGVCPKETKATDFDAHLARAGDWRVVKWMKATPETYKLIERRKRALVRMGLTRPSSREIQKDRLRRSMPRGQVTVPVIND
jgi:hypothetical protein